VPTEQPQSNPVSFSLACISEKSGSWLIKISCVFCLFYTVTFNQCIYARVATTDNGWTSDNVCLNWFTRVFVPQAKAHADSSKPIVLMYDRHGLHVTYEMIDAAWKSNIILFCLPPHTTHKL
jgi:hypothetical protein